MADSPAVSAQRDTVLVLGAGASYGARPHAYLSPLGAKLACYLLRWLEVNEPRGAVASGGRLQTRRRTNRTMGSGTTLTSCVRFSRRRAIQERPTDSSARCRNWRTCRRRAFFIL